MKRLRNLYFQFDKTVNLACFSVKYYSTLVLFHCDKIK